MSKESTVTILDGGMGRELHRIGAPFRQPEWSALALMEAPDKVRDVHEAYLTAGANIITTNSFAVVPYHIGAECFATRGYELAALSGHLGREAIVNVGKSGARLAGSLPPPFGSYRPDLFQPDKAHEILSVIVSALSPSVDLWLAETQSSIAEAKAARDAIGQADSRPFWLSFTLYDDDAISVPQLRSGETIENAVDAAFDLNASALLFNCSDVYVMERALTLAGDLFRRSGRKKIPHLGVYANAFVSHEPKVPRQANEVIMPIKKDMTPDLYLDFARSWCGAGARIIGGCCGIGPEHISILAKNLI